ncbi:MAG: carbohydrate ABC transporter permease [Phototrophicales bacterium]|nr:carbohydrate ABC transporter permease [Phototrophicales bacterium]
MTASSIDMQPERKPLISKAVRGRTFGIIAVSILVLFALLQTMPFVLTFANSFKCRAVVQQRPQVFIPALPFGADCRTEGGSAFPIDATSTTITFNPTLEGYNNVFEYNLGLWVLNTVYYASAVTILRLAFDSLAGYALARINFFGNRAFFFLILGTMMIPGVVLLIPRFIILQQLGLINTYQGVVITLGADAFGVFLMKQFFESIPKELEEAAMVDGATRFTLFFRVVLPMATPALTALAIFSFQGTWNNFMDLLIIVGGDASKHNLPLGLAQLRGQFGETLEWNTFLAGAVITTVPLAIIFFFFQRYFVEGISYSGLKG